MQGQDKKECQTSIKKQEIVVLEKEIGDKEEEKRDDAMENTEKLEIHWVHYFRKGKARVLSSGLVVGDPGTWRAVKSNRFASLGEDTTNTVTSDANTSSANIPSPVITTNVHERKETGEMNKKETAKEWGSGVKKVHANEKDNSNEKQITVDKTAKEESNANEVNEATIDNYQSIEQQSAEDNGGIENDCNSEQVNNKEITVFQSHHVVQHTEEVANDKAFIMVPNQTDVIQVISPIRVLHNIVSHNLGEEELLVLEENHATYVSEVEYPNEEMNYLPLEADLSPKLLKSSRKGKQQASGVENQCIRV
ncbi:hypothetical protein KY285_036404 [Solanum tuberosum]|nr:hypothetical protein KY285_036404 [Solanum tuberosum]